VRSFVGKSSRLIYFLVVSSFVPSCGGRQPPATEGCCENLRADRVLDEPPVPDELETGRVDVELRSDHKAVVATVGDRDHKRAFLYSADGGDTWRVDNFYEHLRSWQTQPLREGEILPWTPNPADASVKYRTISFRERKSYDERSTDGGKSWTRMKEALLGYGTRMVQGGLIFYHPRDPLTFYIAGDLPGWQYGGGMFVSVDGGDTFRFMYASGGIDTLAISQSNPAVMYGAGSMGSLLKSVDGGKIWDLVGQNDLIRKTRVRTMAAETKAIAKLFDEWPTEVEGIAIDPVDVNRVYVATSKGILRTENGGETWCILINTGITKARSVHSVVIVPTQPNVLFVGTYKGLMRSVDRGCHWEQIDVLSRVQR